MITYKNITDVEVLENVPENAMALVNDGGELKQVACKEMGGNSNNGWVTIVYKDGVFTSDTTLEEMLEMCATYKFKGVSLIEYEHLVEFNYNSIEVLYCLEVRCYEDYCFISFRSAGGGLHMVDVYWRQSGIEQHYTPV